MPSENACRSSALALLRATQASRRLPVALTGDRKGSRSEGKSLQRNGRKGAVSDGTPGYPMNRYRRTWASGVRFVAVRVMASRRVT